MSSKKQKNNSIEPAETNVLDLAPITEIITKAAPIVLILLSLTLIIFNKANTNAVERLRIATVDTVTPILTIVSAPIISAVQSIDEVASMRDLKAENIRLKEENIKLTQWYETALKLKAENKSFRELLNVKADKALSFVSARVISDAGNTFVKSVLIPAGKKDGLQKGNIAMSGNGLVGRVIEVGKKSSRVLLVTDLNSKIPVIIQNTRTKAILSGKNKDLLKLERLHADSGVSIGARVVTSGDGGHIPADIPIGTIVSSDNNNIWVKPLSEISKITYVQIVNTGIDNLLTANNQLK